jgi:hypothetical protein
MPEPNETGSLQARAQLQPAPLPERRGEASLPTTLARTDYLSQTAVLALLLVVYGLHNGHRTGIRKWKRLLFEYHLAAFAA